MIQVTSNIYVNDRTFEQVRGYPPPFEAYDPRYSRTRPYGCNSSFVKTSEGIIVIDTPYLPIDAVAWRDEVAARGDIRYIINTEPHRDHVSGNYFFPGTVVSSRGVREAFTETLGTPDDVRRRVAEMDPKGVHLVKDYQPRPPAIAFTGRMELHLGDLTFELIQAPGHTPGQVAVYIPQEKVLFTGDNFTNGWQPALGFSNPVEWAKSLRKLENFDASIIVPGHGAAGDMAALRSFRVFIESCVGTVTRAIERGMTREQAADNITFDLPENPPPLHPGAEWQRAGVMRIYDTITGENK